MASIGEILKWLLRHLMSNDYGPFDRFFEILIFGLIAVEVIVGFRRHRKEDNRRRSATELYPFIEKGQRLERTVPDPSRDDPKSVSDPTILAWMGKVSTWIKETQQFLQQRSPRAAAAFGFIAGTGQFANPQTVYTESGRSFWLQGQQRESYQRLVTHLNNLRNIVEKPEAYF